MEKYVNCKVSCLRKTNGFMVEGNLEFCNPDIFFVYHSADSHSSAAGTDLEDGVRFVFVFQRESA